MLPLKLVLDTNVLVSGLINPDGLERSCLTFALTKPAVWFLSSEIIAEYQDVLNRPKLKLNRKHIDELMSLTKTRGVLVTPKIPIDICLDSKDNKFLECAAERGADYLVTGNKKHFPRFWGNTKIINAREFFEAVAFLLN